MKQGRLYSVFIEDILAACDKIQNFVADMDFENFAHNELVIDAVVRNLEIIGEAAKNISEDIQQRYHNIPWHNMIGLRNIVIHNYFGIDLSIIWDIIKNDLPRTQPLLREMLSEIVKEEKK